MDSLIADPDWRVIAIGVLATAALRVVHAAREADRAWILKVIAHDSGPDRVRYYKALDAWFAPLPFVWCWIDIALVIRLGAMAGHWAAWLPVIVVVSGRMRTLQEIGHNAVHCALCRSRDWQWFLSNVFFQFPLMKRDMHSRFITHVRQHHRTPNHPDKDPNLRRIIEGGVRPGITARTFHLRLFYPFTPRGFWINLRTSLVNSTRGNASWRAVVIRVVVLTLALWVIWRAGGVPGLVLGYGVSLLWIYPWFSWVSILGEHRWFCADDEAQDRWQMECINCRPTAFSGLTGWIIGTLIFPLSDKYHLAHSLYPYVRWSYLPTIDRHLRQHDPHYPVFRSEGLLFPRGPLPGALSELRQRLSAPRPGDLASWGERFAVSPRTPPGR